MRWSGGKDEDMERHKLTQHQKRLLIITQVAEAVLIICAFIAFSDHPSWIATRIAACGLVLADLWLIPFLWINKDLNWMRFL